MLPVSWLATRKKDKGAGKPNLRETHHSGLTIAPIIISISKSHVGIPGEYQQHRITNVRDKYYLHQSHIIDTVLDPSNT